MTDLALANMSEAELEELSSKIAYARSQQAPVKFSVAETELWRIMQDIFNRSQPIDHFVRGMDGGTGFGVQRYSACSQALEAVLNKACALGTKRIVRIAMRRFLLDCLCRWLKGANVPLSPKAILQNMDKLEHAVDQEYPGYIEAGMLSFVLAPLPRSE